ADALVLGDVRGGLAEDERLALGGEQEAEQELDRRRLARAVRAEQAEDLALADLDVEGAEGGLLLTAPEVAVDLGSLAGFDDHVLGPDTTSRPGHCRVGKRSLLAGTHRPARRFAGAGAVVTVGRDQVPG